MSDFVEKFSNLNISKIDLPEFKLMKDRFVSLKEKLNEQMTAFLGEAGLQPLGQIGQQGAVSILAGCEIGADGIENSDPCHCFLNQPMIGDCG